MHLSHSQTCGPQQMPNRMSLKRCAILSFAGLAAIGVLTVPHDWGDYARAFRHHGLLGLVGLRSLVALQFGFFLSGVILLGIAIRQSSNRGLRVLVWFLGGVLCVYCLSLWCLSLPYVTAALDGVRNRAFGLVGILGFFASASVLLVGVPAGVIHAIGKLGAESR